MPAAELEYVPKYLFISGEAQPGTRKSRHVMKECEILDRSVGHPC